MICMLRSLGDSVPVYAKNESALAGVAQWIECWPVNQRIASSISSQDMCLVCGPGPQWGVHKRQPHIDTSVPLFLPPFPSA